MQPAPRFAIAPAAAALAAVSSVALLFAYWPTLAELALRWWNDDQYSYAFLVAPFAGYLLWLRREQLGRGPLQPSAWGLALIAGGIGLRMAGAVFHLGYFDQISLLPCLAGLALLAGGRGALSWAWVSIAYLIFMVPLPYTVSVTLTGPMQRFATTVSTFFLQTLGRPALAEGNAILVNDLELRIIEACSGLSMMLSFFALSTALAILVARPVWEKLFIAVSAIPIAFASNVVRITVTALTFEMFGSASLGHFLHDANGYLMPALGMAFLALELWVLSNLILDDAGRGPLPGAVTLQRVEVNPVSMYGANSSPRRARRAAPAAPAEPASEPTPVATTHQS